MVFKSENELSPQYLSEFLSPAQEAAWMQEKGAQGVHTHFTQMYVKHLFSGYIVAFLYCEHVPECISPHPTS